MRARCARDSGVTLVELLVVLVIVSTALTIVTPSMIKSYDNWVLRSTGQKAVALFRFASDAARHEGSDIAVYYTDHRFMLLKNHAVFRELEIPTSVTVRPEKPEAVVFLTTGQIVAPNKAFELENTRGRRVRIQFGDASQIRLREAFE